MDCRKMEAGSWKKLSADAKKIVMNCKMQLEIIILTAIRRLKDENQIHKLNCE